MNELNILIEKLTQWAELEVSKISTGVERDPPKWGTEVR